MALKRVLFVILICLQPFCKHYSFSLHLHNGDLHTRLTECSHFRAFSNMPVPFSLMFVVIGLLGSCSMYLLICILYALSFIGFYFLLLLNDIMSSPFA